MSLLPIQVSTLTPLWTGGVEATANDRIHTTGLLGSLRWWYEILARGVGGTVCDPSVSPCQYDEKALQHGLCEVSKVFGATGYSKRFRLSVDDSQMREATGPGVRQRRGDFRIEAARTTPRGQRPTWYLNSAALEGPLKLTIIPLHSEFNTGLIGGLLQFIARWGSLGAKPQIGLGVINLASAQNTGVLQEKLVQIRDTAQPDPKLPSLANMFFARLNVSNLDYRETFNLKYDLRGLFRADQNLRHHLMGTVNSDRQGSKVILSLPYQENGAKVIRVWGWVPAWRGYSLTRDQTIQRIYDHLLRQSGLQQGSWREFNAPDRDATGYKDISEFVNQMMS
jgi:CRISPR-associated protein Cmr1